MKQGKMWMMMALAMVLAGGVQAATPVTDNLPGLPVQGADYWKAVEKEQAAAQAAELKTVPSDETFFYTGKPYVSELDAYSFQFRNYNPELQRWTTADPSGFPDGANNYGYVTDPMKKLDPLGLWRTGTHYGNPYNLPEPVPFDDYSDKGAAGFAPTVFAGMGDELSQRAVQHLINGTAAVISDITLSQDEQNAFQSDSAFQPVRDFVQSQMETNYGTSAHFGPPLAGTGITFTGGDLHFAINNVTVNLSGDLTPSLSSDGDQWQYNGSLNLSFTDPYDFAAGDDALVNVFAKLQNHGWTSQFNITGNWSVNFEGSYE